MVIRNANIEDAQKLIPLLRQLGYEDLDEKALGAKIGEYSKPGYAILIAEADHQVLAFISVHIYENFHSAGKIGRITALCVDEKHRSKGIGANLLDEVENLFRQHGCRKLEVTSNNRRTATHAFYLRRGYLEDSKKFVRNL